MLPGIYEFRLDAAHLIFLGAFYTVAAVIAGALLCAAARTLRDVRDGRAETIRWMEEFHGLPAACRACRHEITGEAAARTCDRAFDCRACATHPSFPSTRVLARCATDEALQLVGGLAIPADRYYHRGHAWARPEPDGSVTVGLDAFASHLVGPPDRVDLPAKGARVVVNGTAWHLHKRGADLRVLSPVDGTVIETGGPGRDFYLRVEPSGGSADVTHLLRGGEIAPWILREMDRVGIAAGSDGLGASLADGGTWVVDPTASLTDDRRDSILGGALLDL